MAAKGRDRSSTPPACRLYRFRRQFELAFKRLKNLIKLEDFAAIDPALTKAALYARLILAVFPQSLVAQVIALSRSSKPIT